MGFLDKMAINMAHKAIVYVSGIILIFSIFVEVRVLDNTKIMILAGVTLLYGILLWLISDTLAQYDEYFMRYRERYINIANSKKLFLHFLYFIIIGLILLYWNGLI